MAVSIPSVDITSSDPAYASGPATVNYTLNGISDGNAWLAVKNSTGSIIRMVNGGPVSGSGPHSIYWDGKDGSGNPVPVGNYKLLIAVNRSGLEYVGEWGGKSVAYPQAWGVAINSTGYAYLTDSVNANVFIYDPSGNCVRVFGTPGTSPGQLSCPGNPAINSTGHVFIADYSMKRLEVFDRNGGFVGEINYTSGPGQFVGPGDVALNSTGHIYVTDYEGHNVKVFSPSWAYEYTIGSSGTGNGKFNYPTGIAMDAFDHMYVSDSGNNRVQVFDRTGAFLSSFGSSGMPANRLNCPNGISVNSTGYIYVVDGNSNRVQVYDTTGTFSYAFGSYGSNNGQFNYPYGIAVNSSGFVYVADNGNGRVEVFNASGGYTNTLGPVNAEYGKFYQPMGITVGPNGLVYVVDTYNYRIQVFDQFGDFLFAFGSKGTGDGQLSEAYGIAVNSSGYIYVPEYSKHRVQVFDPSGHFLFKFGSEGGGNGQFGTLWDIAVNSTDYVYVGDRGNPPDNYPRVQVFDAMGNYRSQFNEGYWYLLWSPNGLAFNSTDYLYAIDNYYDPIYGHPRRICVYNSSNRYQFEYGNNGTGNGQFLNPTGIAIDPLGFTYISDTSNQRIQMFTPMGAFVSKIGAYGKGGGNFSTPYDVAVGNSGAVYVADSYNNRIQVLSDYVIANVTLIVERTAPLVVSTSPTVGDSHVGVGDHITATLSEPANASTVNASTFYVYPTSSPGSLMSGTFSVSGNNITFIPDAPLTGGVGYTATVTTGVTDRAGNALASNYPWSFTVEDLSSPSVLSTTPSNGAIGVGLSTNIVIVFNETISASTVNASSFYVYLTSSPGSHLDGTIAVSGSQATFEPASTLTEETSYTAVAAGSITDVAGNTLGSDHAWSFTTGDFTPPSIFVTAPTAGETEVNVNSDIIVTFTEPVDASTVNASSFYVYPDSNPGSHPGGTITVSGSSITLDSTDALDGNTAFTGYVSGGITDLAGNPLGTNYQWSFTTEDLTPVAASFTSNATAGVAPLTVRFNDTSTGNLKTWNWSFGDGSGNVTTRNATHTFTDIGDYQVNLTVTNSTSSRTASKTIMVLAFGPVKNLRTGLTYMSIQAAIDDPNTINGDTVLVNSSTYAENVVVDKELTLMGNDTGSGKPVVDGYGNDAITVSAANVAVRNFTVTNAIGFYKAGIAVTGKNTTIANNTATSNNFGIYLYHSCNNTVTNNTASYNSRGIYLDYYSDYNNLTNNTANHNDVGIAMILGKYNNITGNTANYNAVYYGIGLVGCDNNNLTGNKLNNNRMGINLQTSNNNCLTGNMISDNSEYGFYVTGSSYGNVIWLNNISYSPNNALSHAGMNFWNSTVMMDYSYNGETFHNYTGNYWSDYSAPDANLDGIGDVPYKIYYGFNSSSQLPEYLDNPDYYPMLQSGQTLPGPVSNVRTGLTYWSIQAAIDDSDTIAGDTILVNSSVYRERVQLYKALNLVGNDIGSGLPVVDGYGGTCLYITVDGVNLQGFNATNASTGIYVGSSHNNVTGNIAFNNTYDGIDVWYSNNNITGNTVNNNSFEGIYLNAGSQHNNVTGNTANYNGYASIYLDNANDNNVTGNTVNDGEDYGVLLQGTSEHNLVSGNTANSNKNTGIQVNGPHNNFTENTVNGNSYGLYVQGSDNNLTGNTANFNSQSGIMVSLCSGNNVTGNTANNNNNVGIYTSNSDGNLLAENIVNFNTRGFLLTGVSGNNLTGNTASNNAWEGIYVYAGVNNNFTENTISGNTHGIYIEGVNSGNFFGTNTITSNAGYGIYLGDSSNGNLTANTVTGNVDGIYLRDSTNNVLWLNLITDNTINGSTNGAGANHWNSTAQVSYDYAGGTFTNYTGNYWGDYTGPDANVDGIGDIQYDIATDTPDYYPMLLTEPALPILQLNLTSYTVNENDGSVTLKVNRSGYAAPAVAVDYTVTPGTAADSINYQAPTSNPDTLNIPAFATSGDIVIPILDDGLYGLPKEFTVTLSSSSGATLGTNTSATVTIVDQDPAPELYFASPAYEVNEGDGTVTITVTRVNNADTNTAVEFNTTDGTAYEGVNYENTSGLLMFNHDVMSRTFTVNIYDDGVATGDLTFNVKLTKVYSSPPHATIGSPSETSVTIHDNDAPIMPVADFVADVTSGVAPLTVHFSSLSTGLPTLCEWNFGDGSSNMSGFAVMHTYNGTGLFTITMTASNSNGSSTMQKVDYIRVTSVPVTSYTIDLKSGWNLVSEPLLLSDHDASADNFFAPVQDKITIVWTYDANSGTWLSYVPGASGNDLTTIDEKSGYIVLAKEDSSIVVYGDTPGVETINLYSSGSGWNLIGHPSMNINPTGVEFAGIAGKYNIIWGFDRNTQTWLSYVGGASGNDLLNIGPGEGYLVMMNSDSTYTVG